MSPRFSRVSFDRIDFEFWLTVDAEGELAMTRGRPRLAPHQRAVSCVLTVPKAVFKTPELRVAITVADPGAPAIDVHAAAETVADALAQGCDLKVVVTAAEPQP